MVTTEADAGTGLHMTPAAARILEVASELFYRRGIRAVGMDTIAEGAGVTKKTVYDRFGSKDVLVAAYLRGRDERWRAWLARCVERAGSDPKERLLATFDGLGAWMKEENPRGCGFVNAMAELTEPNHPGRQVAVQQKAWVRDYLTALAAVAGASDPGRAGDQLLILLEGATVAYSMGQNDRAAETARELAARVVADF